MTLEITSTKQPLSLDAIIKVAFCLEGRDKLTKITQYGSRALAWYLLTQDPKSDLGKRFHSLYKSAQQSRKAFRVGKSLNEYKKGFKALNDKSIPPVQQYLALIRHIGMFGYFLFDNAVFFSRAKFLKIDASEAGKQGSRWWFTANVAGLILALRLLEKDLQREKKLVAHKKNDEAVESEDDFEQELKKLRKVRFKKYLGVVKSMCDLVISSNASGIRLPERVLGSKLNDGVMGSLGCISACVVLYNTYPDA